MNNFDIVLVLSLFSMTVAEKRFWSLGVPQHFFAFFPEPQGQGSFLPALCITTISIINTKVSVHEIGISDCTTSLEFGRGSA